ncbi:MAG: endolytic transglycosylase MltG [Candidatus Binataceae bacterium]
MPPRSKSKLAIVAAAILAAVIAGYAALAYYWFSPAAPLVPPARVMIERGERFPQIARALARNGVVRSGFALRIYAELSGAARRVKPGEYEFRGGERIPVVMRHLVRGDFIAVTVTIPEGLTVHQIAQRLGDAGLACPDNFERAARSGAIVRALGLIPFGAEGYLFPATYKFPPNATVDRILETMLARFYRVLTPAAEERMFALGMTPRQIVTMASMVEKEAHVPGERPLIAGVFYNRLRLKMPLQSDPTAEYGLGGESLRPAAAVRTPSAFNTYEITGLPPGPIANPGLSSIEAALYPAKTDYLYFVARPGGAHVFSRTFAEHQRQIGEHRAAK